MDHYSKTKRIAEQKVLEADKENVLRTCALRLGGVYGVGEQRHIPRVVVRFICLILILLIIKEINNEQATVALPLVKVSHNTAVDDQSFKLGRLSFKLEIYLH